MTDLTCDDFLGGKVRLWQPRKGYRAGVDPVFLAAACPATAGQTVLELGCGVGAASLCLAARVPVKVTGIEVQPDYADLARKNAAENSADYTVHTADLRSLPPEVRNTTYDHVIMNPPYYDRSASTAATDTGRDIALGGDTPMADWIDTATRRLAPKGYLTLIQRIDRLPDMLAAIDERLGSIVVKPLQPRVGRESTLFILQARKGGRAAFRLLSPLLLHAGDAHIFEGESYTTDVTAILRAGQTLGMF